MIHIILELCDIDLASELRNLPGRKMPMDMIRNLVAQMSQATKYLAQMKVIHRDIKPGNILIKHIPEEGLRYKLTDFGMVRIRGLAQLGDFTIVFDLQVKNFIRQEDRTLDSVKPMTVTGTELYMAPEIKHGPAVRPDPRRRSLPCTLYNAKVDSWSLGLVFLEAYSGYLPQDEMAIKKALKAVLSNEAWNLHRILFHLLVKDPKKRAYLHDLSWEQSARPSFKRSTSGRRSLRKAFTPKK